MKAKAQLVLVSFVVICLFGCQYNGVHSTSSQPDLTILEKGRQDPSSYGYLTLNNGLKVLLISDMQQRKAYGSLSAAAGYFQDPNDIPGLAHLYEHMLSKGSINYPQAAEYKAFLAASGGSSNASTSGQRTNYYFQVNQQAFAPALARFAGQFIAPLLPAELVYKERHAVEAEFRMKYRDNYRRKREVLRTLVNQAHPYRKFSTGNLQTLKDVPNLSLHQALVDFGKDYYCAERMGATLMAPLSLAEMAKLAKQAFSAVPSHCAKPLAHLPAPFSQNQITKQLAIKTLRSRNRLMLSFPLALPEHARKMLASDYLEWLFDAANTQGLEAYLQQLGAISHLRASQQTIDNQHILFNLEFRLTKQGSQQIAQIKAATLSYLELIRQQGASMSLFNQFARLQRADYDRDSKHLGSSRVRALADQTLFRAPQYILLDGRVATENNVSLLAAWLQQLSGARMLQIREHKSLRTDQIEPIYQTRYQVSDRDVLTSGDAGLAASELASIPRGTMTLPGSSPYFARANPISAETPDSPTRLLDTAAHTALYIPAVKSKDGYLAMDFYFDSNPAKPDFALLNPLFVKRLNHQLRTVIRHAHEALIDLKLTATKQGMKLSVAGYGGNWPLLMADITQVLTHPSLNESDRRLTLKYFKANLDGFAYDRLSSQTLYRLNSALGLSVVHEDRQDYFAHFNEQAYDEFVSGYLQTAHLTSLYYGAVTEQLWRSNNHTLQPLLSKVIEPATAHSAIWTPPHHALMEQVYSANGGDSAIRLMYIPTTNTPRSDAMIAMAGALARAPFFHQLRTIEQLGYSVKARALTKYGQDYLGFYVQSDKLNSAQLLARVEEFNGWFSDHVAHLSEEEFNQVKANLVSELQQPYINNESASGTLVYNYRYGRDADYQQQLLQALAQMSLASFEQQVNALLQSQPSGLLLDPKPTHQP
ncbi:MAG: insulinase family protein [Alteromonadaceae bacterium]|nr:insulinase family protein [Alteromonadaceae bacterium]